MNVQAPVTKTQRYLQIALIALGSFNIVGFITEQPWLRGVAIASMASPLPFVFSQFRGYETFAANFTVVARYDDGREQIVPITPALYSKLGGSYNRRNTYGAVVSYGPRMTSQAEQDLTHHVLSYGFCNSGPLAQLLDDPALAQAKLIVQSRTLGSDEVWQKVVECDDSHN